ncbi:hypothetical protein ACHAXR_013300 [Thalassiosira sp. AJA248-18]
MVTVVEYLSAAVKGKPIDGSDVSTLEEARVELTRLRRVAYRVCDILSKTSAVAPGAGADGKQQQTSKKKIHRAALADDDAYKFYKKLTVTKSDGARQLLKSAISKSPLFKGCTDENLSDFVDVFAPKKFSGGSTVIQQGDKGETFYVVESGNLDIYINVGEGADRTETQVGIPYGSGMTFGELALIYGSPRAATIRASKDCVLWEINRTAFRGLQLQHEQHAHQLKLTSLRSVKVGGDKSFGDVLSNADLESMALAVKSQSFSKGDAIIREGEKGDVFYVITKGSVTVSKGGETLANLPVNSFFGEKALLSSDTRNATCIAATEVECLTLLRDDFVLLLGNLEDLLAGKRRMVREQSKQRMAVTTNYSMSDLEKKGVLGEGAFGKVNLVKSKKDGSLFALKAQSKAFLVKHGQEGHTIGEFQLLRQLDHPFIVKIFQAMQDKKYVYFLMNLLPGGELMDLLDSKRQFPENWTRFYAASVLSAFQSIHAKQIAYRDLKPENLVLDADGYCYVIDFGLAKNCVKGKTWTFCGTPDYLAPEIVRGKGHDWGVDYWGFGVLLFELTHGFPPFYADDPTNTARKIIKGTFNIPAKFSDALVDLIHRLLCEQSKRLGRTQGGAAEIIKHQWFSGFDWSALLDKTMTVPSKPKIGNLESLGRRDHGVARALDSDWTPVFD